MNLCAPKTRRIANVMITAEAVWGLIAILHRDSERRIDWVEGFPSTARFEGMCRAENPTQTWIIQISDDSFEEVREGDVVPVITPTFKIENLNEHDWKSRSYSVGYDHGVRDARYRINELAQSGQESRAAAIVPIPPSTAK